MWIAGLILYLGVVWYIGIDRLRNAFTALDYWYLLAFMALDAAATWLRVLKWRFMLGHGSSAAGLFFLSKLGGAFTPMRLGELSPLMLKDHRSPRLAAWIVVDRMLETSATLVLGGAGVLVLGLARHHLFMPLALAAVILLVAPPYLATRGQWFEAFAKRLPERGRSRKAVEFVAQSSGAIRALLPRTPMAALLTVTATCMDLALAVILLAAFGHGINMSLAAVVQCVHGIISLLPFTPNASGIPYVGVAMLLKELAGVPYEVMAAAVPVQAAARGVVFWSSLGAGLWLMQKGKLERHGNT